MSTAVESKTEVTPEDLLAMPDGVGFELVDGELVERKVSFESTWVATKLARLFDKVVGIDDLGAVLGSDLGYRCFPGEPKKVRKPDVSFMRWDRVRAEDMEAGFCSVAPDLAVEVVSPNDVLFEVEAKVAEYLDAGVREVWLVRPQSRIVEVHCGGGRVTIFTRGEDLTCEAIIPGFRCSVAELFRPAVAR